jgi:ubiquitin-protein ligase
MASLKRIKAEWDDIIKNPTPNLLAHPLKNNLFKWEGTIYGPSKSPYDGGIFILDIILPQNYPFSPPQIKFRTNIYHCNISNGEICLDILKESWSPALTITKVLLSICSLLDDPNPDDPLILSIAELYKENREAYYNTAKEYTLKYATS